jgi:serine/threonine protein kinase
VLHRDIKPDNIGWTADGTIKLFDFGLCAVVLGKDSSRLQYNRGYRMTGNTGTLRYMAPEVALNEPYHNGVDVYSFAVVVWQVLAGQIPFKEMGKRKYVERVLHALDRHGYPMSLMEGIYLKLSFTYCVSLFGLTYTLTHTHHDHPLPTNLQIHRYMDRVVRKGQRPELKEKWPVGFRDLLNR